jgi:hypothetical protein
MDAQTALAVALGVATISTLGWYNAGRVRNALSRGMAKRPPPIEGLPDPDPLMEFDLASSNTRNFPYANKVRWSSSAQTKPSTDLRRQCGSRTSRRWRTSRCISTTGSRLTVTMIGTSPITVSRDLLLISCRYLSEKARIIAEQGDAVVASYPENDEAAGELLDILVDCESARAHSSLRFDTNMSDLPKRYPTLFKLLPDGIHNLVTDVKILEVSKLRGVPALIACSK